MTGLQEKKIPSTFINSDLSPQEKKLRYELLRRGAFKFLFCTPERFDTGMVRASEVEEITRTRPSYLVVDEAHCIDRWGRDFRPNYDRLGEVRERIGNPPVLAFTATAGVESQKRILASLGVPNARVIVTGVDRPNIALARLELFDDQERYKLIAQLLQRVPSGRVMIFVPTVKVGERLRAGLGALGVDIPFYHSQPGTPNERDLLLGQFLGRLSPERRVVICTNAFGMGLDVPDVRMVIHWQHPASMEDYLQEFGRAGRDGKPSVAILFTRVKDEGLLRYMAEQTVRNAEDTGYSPAETLEFKYQAISEMRRQATHRSACFRQEIIRYFSGKSSTSKRSLAVRIVEWILQTKRKTRALDACCDRCDSVHPRNMLPWVSRILAPNTPSEKVP